MNIFNLHNLYVNVMNETLEYMQSGYPSFPVFVHFSLFLYMMNTFFRDSINAVDSLQKLLIFNNI